MECLTAAGAHAAAPDQRRKREVTAGGPVQSDQLTGGRLSPTDRLPPLDTFTTCHRALQTHMDKHIYIFKKNS